MMGHRLFANYYFYLPIDFSLYCWKMKNAILRCRCPILLSILQFSISLWALSISRYLSGAHCEIKGKQNRFLAAASVMINQMRKSTTRKGRIGRQKKKVCRICCGNGLSRIAPNPLHCQLWTRAILSIQHYFLCVCCVLRGMGLWSAVTPAWSTPSLCIQRQNHLWSLCFYRFCLPFTSKCIFIFRFRMFFFHIFFFFLTRVCLRAHNAFNCLLHSRLFPFICTLSRLAPYIVHIASEWAGPRMRENCHLFCLIGWIAVNSIWHRIAVPLHRV